MGEENTLATEYVPVANGTRTDHPYPGLPFVDDGHLPLDDPEAIEAIGRHDDTDTWGRYDFDRDSTDDQDTWIALTTDPKNYYFCWCVLYHPSLGRSVLLYRDKELGSVHDQFWNDRPRLFIRRAGGYGWDGAGWYRPRQIIDWSHERYDLRPVRHPITITAADLLDSTAAADRGNVYRIARFEERTLSDEQWRHDLARWASHRTGDDRPLDDCLVTLNAPELDRLLTIDQVAERASIAASTLRSYMSREQSDIPTPQGVQGGRPVWSPMVIDDWIERRKRSDAGNILTSGDPDSSELKPALRKAWEEMTWQLRQVLLRPGAPLKRRVDPNQVAVELGWTAAATVEKLLPSKDELRTALERTLLWDLYHSTDLTPGGGRYGLSPSAEALLGWYIRQEPDGVPRMFGGVVHEATDTLQIPRAVVISTLRHAAGAALSENEFEHARAYIDVALPPSETPNRRRTA